MESISAALAFKRQRGFWMVSALALLLSVLTYVNPLLIDSLNARLCAGCATQTILYGTKRFNDIGAWVYVALRLPLVALLVAMILRFPRKVADPPAARSKAHAPATRFFDPLMGLRALACMLVLLGHYFLVIFPFANNGVSAPVRALLRSSPWAGVWVFFALSGYLMGKGFAKGRYSLDESGAFLFYRNRLLRIMPIYVVSIVLVSMYRYPAVLQPHKLWMLIEMMIFDYRGDLPVNPVGALWSVSTEVQFYLLVPALMVGLLWLRSRMRRGFVVVPLLLMVLGTAARLWFVLRSPHRSYSLSYSFIYAPLLSNLDIFVAGLSVNLISRTKVVSSAARLSIGTSLWIGAAAFYAAICGLTYFLLLHRTLEHVWAVGPICCTVFAVLFIHMAERLGRIPMDGRVAGKVFLAIQTVGTLTYCLYVFHPEIYINNASLLAPDHPLRVSLVHFPYVLLQVFAVATFFYLSVEKPFDAHKRVSGTALLDAP